MSRLKKALLRVGAVTIAPDGRLVPTAGRAARSREIFDAEAKERQRVRKGNQPGATVANVPQLNSLKSRDAAGKAFGVGYSCDQLLLADSGGVTVFQSRRPIVADETATVEIGAVLGASGACAISQSSVARQSRRCNLSKGVQV